VKNRGGNRDGRRENGVVGNKMMSVVGRPTKE